jgi:hypothetical protein
MRLFCPVVAIAGMIMTAGAVCAQTSETDFQISRAHTSALSNRKLYALELTCAVNPKGGDLAPIRSNGALPAIFWGKTTTTAHFVVVSPNPAAALPDGSVQLPNGAVGMAFAYATNGDKGAEQDNRKGCDQSFLVSNTSKLFVIPTLDLSTTYTPGAIFTAIDSVIAIVTPLVPLLTGAPINPMISKTVSAVDSTQKPFASLLALLNKNRNIGRSYDLPAGTTYITTEYSVVTVNVRELSSVVTDRNQKYIGDMTKQIASAPQKLDASSNQTIQSSCSLFANAVARLGFGSIDDQAFALAYAAQQSFSTRDQMVHCLGAAGASYCTAAEKLDLLWSGTLGNLRPSVADCANIVPPPVTVVQPTFDTWLKQQMDSLMVALGQYAKNKPPLPAAASELRQLFSTEVSLIDRTTGAIFALDTPPKSIPSLIDLLIGKGFYHYGCFAQNSDATGQFANGASVIFLAFKAPADATSAKQSDALAVFPVYGGGSIASLTISDNVDWIKAVLTNRASAYDCNGFQIAQ